MVSISPPLFSSDIGNWPLEEALCLENQNYFFADPTNSFLINYHNNPLSSEDNDQLPLTTVIDRSATTSISTNSAIRSDILISHSAKKLNHNASERDRRKKINQLYSALRELLPASDHAKKVSIPGTVSCALKYIPELQSQVEGLVRKRDELLSKINLRKHRSDLRAEREILNEMKIATPTLISSVSVSQLNNKEVALQISSYKLLTNSLLSYMLRNLEEAGLSVLNASSFESVGGRVFHNLHFQFDGSDHSVKCRSVREKLISLCGNKEILL